MRDGEYIALRMYKDALNVRHGERFYSMSSALNGIMFGNIPPIPKNILDMGMAEAERIQKERDKQPKKIKEPQEPVIGGGIFTF